MLGYQITVLFSSPVESLKIKSHQTQSWQLTLFRLDILGIDNGVDRSMSDAVSFASSFIDIVAGVIWALLIFVVGGVSVAAIDVTTIVSPLWNLLIASTVVESSLTLTADESLVFAVRLLHINRPNTIIIETIKISTAMAKKMQV